MSLQKNRLRSAKNVIFALLCILVDRPIGGGGLNPQPPPLRTPFQYYIKYLFHFAKHLRYSVCFAVEHGRRRALQYTAYAIACLLLAAGFCKKNKSFR